MIIIKIDDSDYEWLISDNEIFDDIVKADRFVLSWTKIKKIDFDDTITWFARNIRLIDYNVNRMIDFDIKTKNR